MGPETQAAGPASCGGGCESPAVILDLGLSGLEVCRALGRRGVPVFGFDTRMGIAARSRYCRASVSADPRTQASEVCRTLIALAETQPRPPVLMPLSDEWLVFASRCRDSLAPHFQFVLPSPAVVESLTDRAECYALARRHGLDVPRHAAVESQADLERAASEIGYPCVLKPARSSDWARPEARSVMGARKIAPVEDARTLAAVYQQAQPFARRHVLEELIPGPDTNNYYVVCYLDRGGTPRARFVHRKILMRPPGRGIGCLIESVEDRRLADVAAEFLSAAGHVGLAGMEFKMDPRDGSPKLLDLNPRWGQGDSLAAICGPDMAWLYYCDSVGSPLAEEGGYRAGVKWVQLRSYLRSALAVRRERGVSPLRSLLDLRGELHHSLLAWDDLGPGAWVLGELLGGRTLRRRSRAVKAADGGPRRSDGR